MSDRGRFWSRHIRGINFAEHGITRELGEYHNEETNLCYPNHKTLCDHYECSRIYLKQILYRLETWQLISRVEWFEDHKDFRQTANRYRLHFDRYFPDPYPPAPQRKNGDKNKNQTPQPYDERDLAAFEGAQQGRRILQAVRNLIPDRTLKEGVMQAFVQKRPGRRTSRVQPKSKLWLAIESESHERNFLDYLPEISKQLRDTLLSEQPFEIELLKVFYKKRTRVTQPA